MLKERLRCPCKRLRRCGAVSVHVDGIVDHCHGAQSDTPAVSDQSAGPVLRTGPRPSR